MPPYALPTLRDVDKAAAIISSEVTKTPIRTSHYLSDLCTDNLATSCLDNSANHHIQLFLKCENLQQTGSFKFRGASHFIARLNDCELSNGLVAYSTGNHALAVAHAAQLASQKRGTHIPTYVVVPSNCSSIKIAAAKRYGAIVLLAGNDPNDRVHLAEQIQKSTGAILVPPADHVNIALGQATAIREFLQQTAAMQHSLDAVMVPSGGGGLLVGATAVCKPHGVTVFGAEPESGGPGLARAIRNGERSLHVEGSPTIADGLRSLTGEANWEHIRRQENVDRVFTVSERHIHEALRLAVKELGLMIEPNAAVPLAVALFSPEFQRRVAATKGNFKLGIVLTGCNISPEKLQSIILSEIDVD